MSKMELLKSEISALQSRKAAISAEIDELDRQYKILEYEELELPTEPGWYYVPNAEMYAGGFMVYLDNSGSWDDGWGGGWDSLRELAGAVKVVLP